MVEYGLLIGLIAIAVMGAVTELSCAMDLVFRRAERPFR
jgi:Flp pilus assembly pilin Flp